MISPVYSRKLKRNVYRLDTRISGKRIVRIFIEKADAEKVQYKIKHETNARRYGLTVSAARALLSELVARRLPDVSRAEQSRATRVLNDLLALLPEGIYVDDVTKADVKKYVDKRMREGLKAQSVDRELNIISAMFNAVDNYFPQLAQWRPPKMPRPKILDGRRERLWGADEIEKVLGDLFAPKRNGEQTQAAHARYRVGNKVRFCLLNGLRHGEMNLLLKSDIDWRERKFRIKQGKTGNYKVVGPVGPTSMAILQEFSRRSESDYVFSRSGNITPKFYRILREACNRVNVPYGKNTVGGLVLHDARHTATTKLLENGVSPATAREWMGWSMNSFVLYYSHATVQSREQAGQVLENYAGETVLANAASAGK